MEMWMYEYMNIWTSNHKKYIFCLEVDIEFKTGYLDWALFCTQDLEPGDPGTSQ